MPKFYTVCGLMRFSPDRLLSAHHFAVTLAEIEWTVPAQLVMASPARLHDAVFQAIQSM
jgi:hypothetical protein